MTEIQPLIMCGGAGTRLWPTSRESFPKQFAKLLGPRSSFQETVLRVRGPGFAPRPVILTSRSHYHLVEQQLQEIDIEADILLEPARRDSGPAILAGTTMIGRVDPETPILVVASDHVMQDGEAFREAARAGLAAALAGRIVTFGITPTHPATTFGYIEPGTPTEGATHAVQRFAEKPDAATAVRFVLARMLWNSGNFLFTAATMLDEYKHHDPVTVERVALALDGATHHAGALLLEEEAFKRVEACSIDYAVLEKTARAAVTPLACGWSDIGTWEAIWELGETDDSGNVRQGDVEVFDSSDCLVSTDGPLTSLLGVKDLIVVAHRDAILVADRRRSAEVKGIVEDLRLKGRKEADAHARAHRPWGWYEVIDFGDQFQVKRIVVNPGGRLSLQTHQHRAEHWVVVTGLARVTVGDTVENLGPNQHAYIPLGAVHRLENPGNTPVQLIEVQSGGYLGEDDIVRLEDVYARV
ncbi:mannose-1-phosphate guanylyltransferase/mannose-6-phosphate isomerase [Methylobacterium flocculans]|uniref:mannose-1-phosphate guanylyltransferase/mannose-6-phosphate isomerase n=1 Tax=Methylobacterium flocculans TaxID=2984843 RepID=UPI0021F30800|nr:mannose-1-phosphate guanylyltransferase/mannose-6-phosphate isomerase [Methylobacterium sp. FF17]